jgi:hypothetical protein
MFLGAGYAISVEHATEPRVLECKDFNHGLCRQLLGLALILEVSFLLKWIIWFVSSYGSNSSIIESILHCCEDVLHQVRDKCWLFYEIFEDSHPTRVREPSKRSDL